MLLWVKLLGELCFFTLRICLYVLRIRDFPYNIPTIREGVYISLVKLGRDLTRPISPRMVVKSKGNGTPYFREIRVGEIL